MNWSPAKKALDAFTESARNGAVHAVRCGLELVRLRHELGVLPGRRTDLTSPHAAERLNWADMVSRELGISDDTAQRWMRAARGYLLGVCGRKDDRWWLEGKAGQKSLFAQLELLASKATLRDLATEWTRLMLAASTPDPIGNGGGLLPVPAVTPAQELAALREQGARLAKEVMSSLRLGDLTPTWGDAPLFALLPKDDVRAELRTLSQAAELRRLWLERGDGAMLARRQELLEEAQSVTAELTQLAIAQEEAERRRKKAFRAAAKQAATPKEEAK